MMYDPEESNRRLREAVYNSLIEDFSEGFDLTGWANDGTLLGKGMRLGLDKDTIL
jgi:hypothetical protein